MLGVSNVEIEFKLDYLTLQEVKYSKILHLVDR